MHAHPSPSTFRAARALLGSRRRRAVLGLVRLMQLMAIVLGLQLSGAAHRIADLLFDDDCSAQCGHERSEGDDDSECPPGCPTCHGCAHVQVPYVPVAPGLGLPPLATVVDPPHGERVVLPLGQRTFVFRPPRSDRSSVVQS